MEIVKSLIVDLLTPGLGPIPIVHAKPDDTIRKLQLTLTSGGAAWTPPSGTTAAVRFRKPDNTSGIYDTLADGSAAYTIDSNVVTISLIPEILSCPGDVMMDVLLVSDSGTLATFNITVRVQAAPALGTENSGDFYRCTTLEQINNAIDDLYNRVGSGGTGGSGLSLDTTLTKSDYAADAKAVGAAISNVKTSIGTLSGLLTTVKTSIVAAVNELVRRVAMLESGGSSGTGTTTATETFVPWTDYTIPFSQFPSTIAGTKLAIQMLGPHGELLNFDIRPYAGKAFTADAQTTYGFSYYDSAAGFPVTIRVVNSGTDLSVEHDSGSGMEMLGFFYTGSMATSGNEGADVAGTEGRAQEV